MNGADPPLSLTGEAENAYTHSARCPLDGPSPRVTVAPMRPDPTYKDIFGHAFMVEELMRWLVAELHGARSLVDALDFSRLRRVHEQSVAPHAGGLHRHANDMVWRVPFRDRDEDDADAWLYLVLMLEFQSEVDFLMPLRIRNYTDNVHMEHWRGKRFRSTDRLAPVLPIVLYTGTTPWSAAARVIDLVTPGASGAGGGDSGVVSRTSPLFAGDGYLVLDTLRVAADDLRHDNAAALLAGLENPSLERIADQMTALRRRLSAHELAALREVMLLWAQQVARRRIGLDLEIRDMAQVERLHESGDLEEYFAARVRAWQDEYRAEGRAEGIERGIERGIEQGLAAERDLLRRLAARKFGVGTGERLAGLLAQMGDTRRLAEVGDWIIDCATGDDLIARFGNGAGSGR